MNDMERIILSNVIHNEQYARAVLPHLKKEYFADRNTQRLYEIIDTFFEKHNTIPTPNVIQIEIENMDLFEDDYRLLCSYNTQLSKKPEEIHYNYLLEISEKFCQDRSIYIGIMECIQILDGKSNKEKGAIPKILSDALSVAFDTHIGHDYFEDYEKRFEEYHKKLSKIPFLHDILNKITQDGVPRKTLNMLLGVTGAGKTHVMCDFASGYLTLGYNVLYITLEMAEERIAERIDANLLNVTLEELKDLPLDSYKRKLDKIRAKTRGKLIVKEYAPTSVGAGHFRHLFNELRIKRNFVPDIIIIDYLNLCSSSRMRLGANVNTYSYIKAIAEEIRGLAVEFNVVIWSATQANREGYNNSDIDLTNTSESIGLPQTVDFMLGMIVTEELEDMKCMMMKQLKNRYGDPTYYRRFMIGMDRSRMKLFDVPQQQTDNRESTRKVHEETTSTLSRFSGKPQFEDWK